MDHMSHPVSGGLFYLFATRSCVAGGAAASIKGSSGMMIHAAK